MVKQDVRPVTNLKDCKTVLSYLKNSSEFGIRNYLMFKLGMSCVLRISDIIHIKYSDVFTEQGRVKKTLRLKEIKTGKVKEMPLVHVKEDLIEYKRVLDAFMDNQPDKYMKPLKSKELEVVGSGKHATKVLKNDRWLFPSSQHPTQHVSDKTFYKAMKQAKEATNIQYLGTHTPRKTGAYLYYRGGFDDVLEAKNVRPSNDIALAMKVLNHSSEGMTLHYLGLEQDSINKRVVENNAFNINL